jgi:DNA-binding CsgD family transcriptional regulator
MDVAHSTVTRFTPASPTREPSLDLGRVIGSAVEACGSTGQAQTLECRARFGSAVRHYSVHAVPMGSGDVMIVAHESSPAPQIPSRYSDPVPPENSRPFTLTDRQLEVLRLIAIGASDKQIAMRLRISTFTASKHVANILSRMEVACRTEASVLAVRSGLL